MGFVDSLMHTTIYQGYDIHFLKLYIDLRHAELLNFIQFTDKQKDDSDETDSLNSVDDEEEQGNYGKFV